MADEIVIDRSRLSYGDTKRLIVLKMRLQKAEQELDADALESAFQDMSAILEKPIVSIPDRFFVPDAPESARNYAPGWIDWVSQDGFNELQAAAGAAAETGKKAG